MAGVWLENGDAAGVVAAHVAGMWKDMSLLMCLENRGVVGHVAAVVGGLVSSPVARVTAGHVVGVWQNMWLQLWLDMWTCV